jgi:DNA-nicking Smr family endonuclease|tara:strand:- start:107 stop:529 length:423 start_codon:yes stop_codon:yes gene_type:complete
LKRKISDKDKKDWQNFISSKEKLSNKDLYLSNNDIKKKIIKTIDFHGFSLENANNVIGEFIIQCFKKNVNKIIVITGKGLRSKTIENPYVSKDLSILKNSVPNFIKSKPNLMKMIKKIEEANMEDGGQGAFYIFLKKFKE